MRPAGIRAVFACALVQLFIAGCGRSANAPASSPAAKPDVTVTIDGKQHTCVVALHTEAQGSIISCGDVVSFVRDELRLPGGSICDIRTVPVVDETETTRVGNSLEKAGYRVIHKAL